MDVVLKATWSHEIVAVLGDLPLVARPGVVLTLSLVIVHVVLDPLRVVKRLDLFILINL